MYLEQRLLEALKPYKSEVFTLNDYLAGHPELGSKEFESSKRIVELMRRYGMDVEYPFNRMPTAFRARINPSANQRAALMAEYDALPEIGHACGHCASGSATVLAALALHELREQYDFGIDIIGTPDEEMTGGKCYMVDDGVFNGYDFAAMAHMYSKSGLMGSIALDAMLIKFRGAPAHAASAPHEGRNALNAARLFFDAIDMMRQHVLPTARLHGYIRNGGVASNIVPEYAEVEFLTRAPKRSDLNEITAWVQDCAKAAALATRTQVTIEGLGKPFHDMYISEPGGALTTQILSELGLPMETEEGASGSSDVGNVDYVCPAFQPRIGIGQDFSPHTREFAQAMTDTRTHTAIVNAASYLVKLVAKLYRSPELLDSVQRAHRNYRQL